MKRIWQDRTARHLAILLALKFSLLAALWWGFVRDSRPEPDAGAVATALLHAATTAGPRAQEGAP